MFRSRPKENRAEAKALLSSEKATLAHGNSAEKTLAEGRREALFAFGLCTCLAMRVYADCANDSSQIKLALPPDALSVRAALVSQLCATGELFDITDPTLTGRLAEPSNIVAPAMWETHGVRGNLLLAFAVDVHGIIQQVTVLMSSGNRELDAAAVESWRTARYKTPARLDGRPVRALMYFRFKSKVNGS